MFCEHGNLIGSCRACTPERFKSQESQILEDEDCPVWKLFYNNGEYTGPPDRCQNSGVKVADTSPRHLILECTSCGWDWRRWKVSGLDEEPTMPKLVECTKCNETSIEKKSRSNDEICLDCGRKYHREKKAGFYSRK
ncbi:MAG: hypothetical protein QGH13_04320 [Candidatus Thalassarchaeaceae archaeon]|nr:hypothetical protein [Candidatus Thalassarchaeaceae archaeon]